MANMMQFDLVSPEKLLSSQQVEAVLIPGADGDLMAMPGHAPVITSLRPGILRVQTAAGSEEYVVTGGFAEIGESVSVLAEKAVPSAELTQEGFEALVEEAARRCNNTGAYSNQARVQSLSFVAGFEENCDCSLTKHPCDSCHS